MKNLMAYMKPTQMQQSFEGRQMSHLAHNPIHEEHLQKAFQLKQPKLKMSQPKMNDQPGSPWLKMGAK